jgi:hypothetical protein
MLSFVAQEKKFSGRRDHVEPGVEEWMARIHDQWLMAIKRITLDARCPSPGTG